MKTEAWYYIVKFVGDGFNFTEYTSLDYTIYRHHCHDGLYAPINKAKGYINGIDGDNVNFIGIIEEYVKELDTIFILSSDMAIKILQERNNHLLKIMECLISPEKYEIENPYKLIRKITQMLPDFEFDDSIYEPKINFTKTQFYKRYYELILKVQEINTKYLKTYYETDTGRYVLYINCGYEKINLQDINNMYKKLIRGSFIDATTSLERFIKLFNGGTMEEKIKWNEKPSKFASFKISLSTMAEGEIDELNKILAVHFSFVSEGKYVIKSNIEIGKMTPAKNFKFNF